MIQPGLERISSLLARTPLPWRAIHVAGTNGKGSICAYVSGMLDAYNKSNWRRSREADDSKKAKCPPERLRHKPVSHARFTSPHLIDCWDCITIDQQPVSFAVFDAIERKVKQRNEAEAIKASEFELLTATAFELFSQQQVDIGVIEVGMGGRLDATNIIGLQNGLDLPPGTSMETFRPLPLVTAISSLGLDHQAFLGNTLGKIAREKAGIIKPGVPVVYDSNDAREDMQNAYRVIQRVAADNSSPIFKHDTSPFYVECENYLCDLTVRSGLHIHTLNNAWVAFKATWVALQQLGRIPTSLTIKGEELELAHSMLDVVPITIFPGRQQTISIEKLTGRGESVLLDGAHNYESAVALADAVSELRRIEREDGMPTAAEPRPVTWVFAVSDSKDPMDVLSPLLTNVNPGMLGTDDRIFAVEFGPVDGMPWVKPTPAARVLETVRSITKSNVDRSCIFDCGKDISNALRLASEAAQGGPLVIAGSLYLVQDVLRLLRDLE